MKVPHRRVSEQAARNPIARALAWKNVKSFVDEAAASLFLREEGSQQREFVLEIANYLAVATHIALNDKKDKTEEYLPLMDFIGKGAHALMECSNDGFIWRIKYAAPVDYAISSAMLVCQNGSPDAIQKAWLTIYSPRSVQNKPKRKIKK